MEQPPETRRLRIPGGTGAELAARIDAPTEPARAGFLMLHAFGSSKDLKSATRIAEILAASGSLVLRFDFTGVGQSAGDFARTTFSTHVADALAAVEGLRRELAGARAQGMQAKASAAGEAPPPIFLFGHSLGGLVGIRTAHEIPECKGVALLGAPSTTAHLAEILVGRAPEIVSAGEAEVETLGKRVRVGRAMIEELRIHDVLAAVRGLERAMFVIHSKADEVASVDHAEILFDAAPSPKSLMLLDGADHLLLKREQDARLVGNVLAAWASVL